jgi:solute carrier family 25 aspartate/glutamate transporter 12/13
MSKVADQVKESLLGTTSEPQLSKATRAAFMRHALQDSESGEWFLDEKSFVEAVAPENEDYVGRSICMPKHHWASTLSNG